MNRVPVIVRNPAFVEELEPDGDEIDPADLIRDPGDDDEEEKMDNLLKELESRNVEAEELLKEMRDYISSLPEGTGSKQPTVVPNVDVWDTGKVIEQEYRLYPDPTMKEVREGSPIRFGICSRYYRSGFTSIPTIVKILS